MRQFSLQTWKHGNRYNFHIFLSLCKPRAPPHLLSDYHSINILGSARHARPISTRDTRPELHCKWNATGGVRARQCRPHSAPLFATEGAEEERQSFLPHLRLVLFVASNARPAVEPEDGARARLSAPELHPSTPSPAHPTVERGNEALCLCRRCSEHCEGGAALALPAFTRSALD